MSKPAKDPPVSDEAAAAFQRDAIAFFERYGGYESQELFAMAFSHWMLSADDFKLPTEPPSGMITTLKSVADNPHVLLVPVQHPDMTLDYRELHQIVRELTYGIYVLNQLPCIHLDPGYDLGTTCQLPPAYQDTRVGQILVSVDYMMKCLWHGSSFPKDKRAKFTERWRSNLDVNSNGKPETKKPLMPEFVSAGMLDMSKDPDYKMAYDQLPVEQPGDTEMAEERRYFMQHADDLSMQIVAYLQNVQQYKNILVAEPDWLVESIVRIAEDRIDHNGYERLNARLQHHQTMIHEHLGNRDEIKKQLQLIRFIAFITPFLISQRKRMKIPDVSALLPQMLEGDDVKTERELPPLMVHPESKCKTFTSGNHYFHLHGGILVEYETPAVTRAPRAFAEAAPGIMEEVRQLNSKVLIPDGPLQEAYPVSTVTIQDKKYYMLSLTFETYYPGQPTKPRWVAAFLEEIARQKPKKMQAIGDNSMHELYKKFFGYKKAIKFKELLVTNVNLALKSIAIRGLMAMFTSVARKIPASRLSKQDENGFSLMHTAAMCNRPNVITWLILQSMDVNVRRNNSILSSGPTALHLAARCGSLDSAACLISNYANILVTDADGWAAIHHAAFFNHVPILRLMIRKHESLIELQTKNDMKSTPLLLAASSGALDAVKCLLDLGANITREDDRGNSAVHLAALRFHTNVLEYFIELAHEAVPVWKILVDMLSAKEQQMKDSAVKCLEVLSTSSTSHWTSILQADGIPALVDLLKSDSEELQSVAASVLCNISEYNEVRAAIANAKAGEVLIKRLESPVDDIQSRAAIIIADLACVGDNQTLLAELGCIPPLVNLLDSELEDVLVNTVNAVRVMCAGNKANQDAVKENDGIEPLVEFLDVDSDILRAASAAAIAALASGNRQIQDAIVAEGAVRFIVRLIEGRNVTVQVKASAALEALSTGNADSQRKFLDLDAPKALIRLLKIWSVEVKEQGACALWALAGQTKPQQKYIADRIGIPTLIEVLMLKSEKLQYVGCMAMIALGREDLDNQNKICQAGGIAPLVRLLRAQSLTDHVASERVLLAVIKALSTLCVGVAQVNNKMTQRRIAEENAIGLLVEWLVKTASPEIQVEAAVALGCVVLGNAENQAVLNEEPNFSFRNLLDFLKSPNETIRLRAGHALAIFAFNNTPQQFAIREAGGIRGSTFRPFLHSENEVHQCLCAFQMVVLARVITDCDQVTLTAEGVTTLIRNLHSKSDNTLVLASSLVSSLAHTRAGIPDAMVTAGAVEILIELQYSDNVLVKRAAAIALGYLTFNRTAARLLLAKCRNVPRLYEQLMSNMDKHPKIAPEFLDDFKRAKIIGLPAQSLHIHGGPPAVPPKRTDGRPKTSVNIIQRARQERVAAQTRAVSAPPRAFLAHSAQAKTESRSTEQLAAAASLMRGHKSVEPTTDQTIGTEMLGWRRSVAGKT